MIPTGWNEWLSVPAPATRDAEADCVAGDLIDWDLEHDLTRTRLEQIIAGDTWHEVHSRLCKTDDAEAVANELAGEGIETRIETVAPWAGIPRSRVLVFRRRPNLAELCRAGRLHRAQLAGKLESACRRVRGFASLTEAREVFMSLLLREEPDVNAQHDAHVLLWQSPTGGDFRRFDWWPAELKFKPTGYPAPIAKLAMAAVTDAIANKRDVSIVRCSADPLKMGSADMLTALDKLRPALLCVPGERREVNPRWVLAFMTCTKSHPEIFHEASIQGALDAFAVQKYVEAPPGATLPNLIVRTRTTCEDFIRLASL